MNDCNSLVAILVFEWRVDLHYWKLPGARCTCLKSALRAYTFNIIVCYAINAVQNITKHYSKWWEHIKNCYKRLRQL